MSADDTTPTPHIAALEAEVTLSREQLAAPVGAHVDRVHPPHPAERAKARRRRRGFDATDPAALPEDRDHARKVLLVAGVVVAVVGAGVVRKIVR